jgi:lipopolysaccharide/colanic/teichoic acid biosynthesis glycosyltransferase
MAAPRGIQRGLKRAFDLVGASAALVLSSPVLIASALGIAATMGRPVLFKQVRPGKNGEPFTIFKFRTMRPPDASSKAWFRSDAERLTWLGQLLRRTSIDELPELINVIRGEMSLVGPRPLLMEYLPKYTPSEARRHDVLPGITGWAQVNGRQSIPFSKRIELDVWYVDNWSLLLDMKILTLTVLDVFARKDVIPGQDVDDVDDLGLSSDRERVGLD